MFTDKRLNEELSVKQLGITFNSQTSPWRKRHEQKVQEKDALVKTHEDQLKQIQEDIKNRKLRGVSSNALIEKSKYIPQSAQPVKNTLLDSLSP